MRKNQRFWNFCLKNRREWLRMGSTAAAVFLTRSDSYGDTRNSGGTFDRLLPARDAVDHLLFGVADLDQGIEWVEHLTGVKAVAGGSHPGAGTRNALLSLGSRQYLEIIAPDPSQKQAGPRALEVKGLVTPRLITWAAATADIREVARKAQAEGLAIEGPSRGSRARSDGRVLNWETLSVKTELGGVVPFFIQWSAGVTHPSEDSPAGCRLSAIEMEHPQPESVRELLLKLGIEASVKYGDNARLSALLTTPRGKLLLS